MWGEGLGGKGGHRFPPPDKTQVEVQNCGQLQTGVASVEHRSVWPRRRNSILL